MAKLLCRAMVVDVEYRRDENRVELVHGQRNETKFLSILTVYRHLSKSLAVICVSH
jgi:hypothetical protein